MVKLLLATLILSLYVTPNVRAQFCDDMCAYKVLTMSISTYDSNAEEYLKADKVHYINAIVVIDNERELARVLADEVMEYSLNESRSDHSSDGSQLIMYRGYDTKGSRVYLSMVDMGVPGQYLFTVEYPKMFKSSMWVVEKK